MHALNQNMHMSRIKRFSFWLLFLAALLVVLETICCIAISIANTRIQVTIRRKSDIYADQSAQLRVMLDPHIQQLHELDGELGWLYAANYNKDLHQLNSSGLRSTFEYSRSPAPNVIRVAAYGDSFTYGSEVGNADSWPRLMEMDGQSPRLEVLNYGVPGYGTDQALLRYRRSGADYSPSIVVMGFPPADLMRCVNVYRRFFSNAEPPLFKPRFKLDDRGNLMLMKCPMRSRLDYEGLLENPNSVTLFGKDDQWFDPWVYNNPLYDYSATARLICSAMSRIRRRCDTNRPFVHGLFNTNSASYKIQCLIFEMFAEEVRASGAKPLVVFLPGRTTPAPRQLNDLEPYRPMLDHLTMRGIDCVDAGFAFREISTNVIKKSWFASGGHYSPEGNRIVAAWLAKEIRKRCVSTHSKTDETPP